MGAQFTDAMLKAEKPEAKDKWLTEGGRRGEGKLLMRIAADGVKRFYYRMPAGTGSRAPVPLACYDSTGKSGLTLKQARAHRAPALGEWRQSAHLAKDEGCERGVATPLPVGPPSPTSYDHVGYDAVAPCARCP